MRIEAGQIMSPKPLTATTAAPTILEPIQEQGSHVKRTKSSVVGEHKNMNTIGRKMAKKLGFNQNHNNNSDANKGEMKASISKPMAFVHVSGVKTGSEGLQVVDNFEDVDPNVREFLKVAGLNSDLLQSPQARKEIETFVQREDVKQTVQRMSVMHKEKKPSKRFNNNYQQRQQIPPAPTLEPPKPPTPGAMTTG